LAREKDDKSTFHGGRRTYDHPDVGDGKGAKEYYDYHSFGVSKFHVLHYATFR
jgi:hypothetical protein